MRETVRGRNILWLDEAAPRLRIPLRIAARSDRAVRFGFDGLPPALHGVLFFDRPYSWCIEGDRRIRLARHARGQVDVYADWMGETWDEVLWLDAMPVKTAGGYLCADCLPEHREIHATREALWRDHLFEPLLEWISGSLAGAAALRFYRTSDKGGACAKLVGAGDDPDGKFLLGAIALQPGT